MSWRGKDYLEGCDAPGRVKYLLLTLDQYANREGWCNPRLARLAAVMHIDARNVQRARDEAVALYLMLYKPGKWKGHGAEYRLLAKGGAGAIHWDAQRVAKEAAKGWRIGPSKGGASAHRTSKKFQEEREDAAASAGVLRAAEEISAMPTTSDIQRRRNLARTIREAPTDHLRIRYLRTFGKEWEAIYPRARCSGTDRGCERGFPTVEALALHLPECPVQPGVAS